MIDAFVQLLLAVGQVQSDVIGDLPTEVGAKILRYLDTASLISSAGVNRRWNAICRGDPILRRRIHKRLQKERRQRLQAVFDPPAGVEVSRRNPAAMFGQKNGAVVVRATRVEYEVPVKGELKMKRFKVGGKQRKGLKKVDGNNNVCSVSRKVMRM